MESDKAERLVNTWYQLTIPSMNHPSRRKLEILQSSTTDDDIAVSRPTLFESPLYEPTRKFQKSTCQILSIGREKMQKLVQMYISFESQVIESTTKMFNFSNVPSLQRRPQYIPNPSGILDYFSRIPCHQYPENTFSESTINKLLIDYESNYSSAKVFSKISFLLGGSLVGLGMTRYVWRPARVKPLQYLILPLMSALMTFSIVYPKTTVDTLGFICASLGTKASSWKTALEDSFKDAKVRFSKRERED